MARMGIFDSAISLFRLLDPERAHHLAVWALARGLGPRSDGPDDPLLASEQWGLRFPNPVGLAAGFDKDAEAFRGALQLGFGFVETGTVTPRPQPRRRTAGSIKPSKPARRPLTPTELLLPAASDCDQNKN